ncbi:uncharacterized protein LOC133917063 isoform X2 [Phragmites australis]|uniref:uncharacterized protein LOC133917063 isoform X2 n=1 Tax=Phragmites australis TaxID=29695 RepID=UPI002D78ECBD|nr:uncharacterized protein LOC133917063 isoform X2 [Phragmites australis]
MRCPPTHASDRFTESQESYQSRAVTKRGSQRTPCLSGSAARSRALLLPPDPSSQARRIERPMREMAAACSFLQAVLLWAALWQVLSPWTRAAAAAAAAAATAEKPKAAAAPVVAGPVSRVEAARMFQIYYGQGFKVIKNAGDGKSYLLMQNMSKMASKTKYCTGRIKSFVIPLANFSIDTTASPVSFFELLGVLENLKGITSNQVASPCVLQSYTGGNIQLVDRTDAQKLTQFSAHFMNNIDEDKGCNFAAFVPLEEDTPLQSAEWIKYLGTFTNSEDRANSVYDAIKANYLCLKKAAANLSTRFKPIVAWIEYTQGMWTFVKESYQLQYLTDAGAEIVDATITNKRFNSSDPEDMDNFHAILCTVDVVIDQTHSSEPAEYKLSTFLENINVSHDCCFSFVANHRIWRFDKRIGDSRTLGNGSYPLFSMLKKISGLVRWSYLPAPVGSCRSNRSFLPNRELHNNLLQKPCKG